MDTFPEPEEIEKAILKLNGDFKAKDVPEAVKAMFSDKRAGSPNAISTVLHQMIEQEKLVYVRIRRGRRPAIYRKA